jgi:beta-glucosidase-like glycosyl hydrolase
MGAILRHYPIEEAAQCAFKAGEDMILICSSADGVRKSFRAMLEAFQNGDLSIEQLDKSLDHIAEIKNILQPPMDFDTNRLTELSGGIARLNDKLNYRYSSK